MLSIIHVGAHAIIAQHYWQVLNLAIFTQFAKSQKFPTVQCLILPTNGILLLLTLYVFEFVRRRIGEESHN